MADKTGIEWTDATWNPVRGCSRVSEGCRNCYAETVAARFSGVGQPFAGFADRARSGSKWTGNVDVAWHLLDLPLTWRKPRRIFVNSMADLFHEGLPDDDIAVIFGTAVAAHYLRGHTFQILTKRSGRMRELLHKESFWDIVNGHSSMLVLDNTDPLNRRSDDARARADHHDPLSPPPGIWLGVSVENQEAADERIPHLLATPAAKRFLSCEPMLGAVDLTSINIRAWTGDKAPDEGDPDWRFNALSGEHWFRGDDGHSYGGDGPQLSVIDWVICGGESGSGARPMHPDWARALRDQCAAAGVPFFFKQWGNWRSISEGGADWYEHLYRSNRKARDGEDQDTVDETYGRTCKVPTAQMLPDGRAFDKDRFTRPEAFGAGSMMVFQVGKKAAGHLLDGVEHNGVPA